MTRLLCINCNMNVGGAETFLMKLYRSIDREHYQMDFCINVEEKCYYEDEILALGGKIFRIPCKSDNLKEFKHRLTALIKENGYTHVLRITSSAAGFLDLKIAKKAGAKVTIARSSNSSDGGGIKSFLAHRLGRLMYGRYVDVKLAPSDLAAKYTFGKKAYDRGGVCILHNGLALDKFRFNAFERARLRKELGIAPETFVVGHVGRFWPQKNHAFLIDVFEEIKKQRPDSTLLLVGNGYLEDEVRQRVKSKGLTDSVYFLGVRSDVPALLSAFDAFALPSLYEGMPNVVIEAQAAGLPCVISDTVTREANLTGELQYLSLSSKTGEWAETILKFKKTDRLKNSEILKSAGYDINDVAVQFQKYVFGNSN